MSEMQGKNRCSQATARYGIREGDRYSLLYLRILEAGISEIMMADQLLLVGHPHSVRQSEPHHYLRRLANGQSRGATGIMTKSVKYSV